MLQFRAVMVDTAVPEAEPVSWDYHAASYHDGYDAALAGCPEGWTVLTVTASHASPASPPP